MANGGSLFLDEVTELTPPGQAKMLRVIQEREFEPLGSVKTLKANIRIIAATNKDIQSLVREGRFREDLYYRLYVYPITLPPLRERPEDLPVLIDSFIEGMNREMGRKVRGVTREAHNILLKYHWPGNVRELQNVIERLMILSRSDLIDGSDLPRYLRDENGDHSGALENLDGFPKGFSLERHISSFESSTLLKALKQCGFNKTKAANLLGLTRSTFRYKLSKVPSDLFKSVLGVNKGKIYF